jgi:hypothetical protein
MSAPQVTLAARGGDYLGVGGGKTPLIVAVVGTPNLVQAKKQQSKNRLILFLVGLNTWPTLKIDSSITVFFLTFILNLQCLPPSATDSFKLRFTILSFQPITFRIKLTVIVTSRIGARSYFW